MTLILNLHLISRPVEEITPVRQHWLVEQNFPADNPFTSLLGQGIVTITLYQEVLSADQEEWLRCSTFAARYIDHHTVEPFGRDQDQKNIRDSFHHLDLQLALIETNIGHAVAHLYTGEAEEAHQYLEFAQSHKRAAKASWDKLVYQLGLIPHRD